MNPMPNIRRSLLFAALAVLLAGSAAGPATALTPTSPNKDQAADKSAPKIVPEDPATSGSSTEPLSKKLDRSGGGIHPPGDVDPGMAQTPPAIGSGDPPGTPRPRPPRGTAAVTPNAPVARRHDPR